MSLAFLVHGIEESALQESVPTVGEITTAMRYAERGVYTVVPSCDGFAQCIAGVIPRALGDGIAQSTEGRGIAHSRTAVNGGWVGPSPRVTRAMPTGINVTHAAWVWFLTDAQQAASGLQHDTAQRAFMERLRADVHTSLAHAATHNTLGDHWRVTVQPYVESVNGPLSWWQSGAAASQANYINRFPDPVTQAVPGATPAAPVDNPVGPNPSAPMSLFTMAMIGVGVLTGGYVLVQIAPALGDALRSKSRPSPAPTPTPNPRKTRR